MLPTTTHERSRVVRRFELITPAGRVYQFPRPTLLQRLLWLLYSHADIALILAAIAVLLHIAGLAGGALDSLSLDACQEQAISSFGR
jgi:membrane associated rhomboid family serine protease